MAEQHREHDGIVDETQFRELVECYLDGAATQAEADALQAAIESKVVYRELFVTLMLQDEALRQVVTESSSARDLSEEAQLEHAIIESIVQEGLLRRRADEHAERQAETRPLSARREISIAGGRRYPRVIVIPRLAVYAAAAAVVLAGVLLLSNTLAPNRGKQSVPPLAEQAVPADTPAAAPPVLARVTRSVDARWSATGPGFTSAGMVAGEYVLDAGMVELELSDGAQLVLEAPSRIELTSANAIRLNHGRLYAYIPSRATGFTVETDDARLVDVGTAFGVIADTAGTQMHVFEGEVRAASSANLDADEGFTPVLTGQAIRVVSAGETVETTAFDPTIVSRSPVKRIDLIDVVAGGDGTQGRRERGIDIATGSVRDRSLDGAPFAAFSSPQAAGWRDVPAMPMVAGVFTPVGSQPVRVAKNGRTHAGFSEQTAEVFGHLWAGRTLPLPSGYRFDREEVDARLPLGRSPKHGWLVMNANKGICFDLDAMRDQNAGLQARRLTASIMHLGARGSASNFTSDYEAADVWVFVDGEPVLHRADFKPEHDTIALAIDLPASASSLSIAVSLGSDNRGWGDWLLVVDPVIEMRPFDTTKPIQGN